MEHPSLKAALPNGGESALEFLLVSGEYEVLRAVTKAVQQAGGHLNCAISVASGMEYVRRRKLDAVVIDLEVPEGTEFITSIRATGSNRLVVIFGCAGSPQQRNLALKAGANFALQKPLDTDTVAQAIAAARSFMMRERRRYFRHAVSVPVFVSRDNGEQRLVSINLSEGGMAIRAHKAIDQGTLIGFRFTLPSGAEIDGKGEVAWANEDGVMGVRFHFLKNHGQTHLVAWLERSERIGI